MAHTRLFAALAALGLALGPVAPALAGQADGARLAQAEQGQQFSDEQLRSFAVAALEVRKIRSDFMARIQQAGSEDERQQLAREANGQMVSAVEDTPGISVEDYNAIVQAAGEDPELASRIQTIVESESGGQ